MFDYSLYLINDSNIHENRLIKDVSSAIRGGITIFQLRTKELSEEDFISIAKKLKIVCKRGKVPFIINDSPNVASIVRADGIHLGQEDCDIKSAKKIFKGIIGISCNNIKEAKKAKRDGADYIGVGAVFSTKTKKNAKTIGIRGLKRVKRFVDIPIVAIGGINERNARIVLKLKVSGIALISDIMNAKNIRKKSKRIKGIISQYR